jgi:hypothetical protein
MYIVVFVTTPEQLIDVLFSVFCFIAVEIYVCVDCVDLCRGCLCHGSRLSVQYITRGKFRDE